jgi:hypothetical protein
MNSTDYSQNDFLLLVGDNAFQGVNHLSQDKARERVDNMADPDYCAGLILTSLENGANGFMFSINVNILSILKAIKRRNITHPINLHVIVPSAVDYIRVSGQKGMEGLAKSFATQLITSGNAKAFIACIKGLAKKDLNSLLKGLLYVELAQVKKSLGKCAQIDSIILHELLTDMALSLDLKWFFKSYLSIVHSFKTRPGFETRNFCLLIRKLDEWGFDAKEPFIVAPFNSLGFQMTPSKKECENALNGLHSNNLIAINILASGYLTPNQAIAYINSLPGVAGVAVGVSKEKHAHETFKVLMPLKKTR